ncbi:MAG: glycosyltransferase family 39 protein [Planctomycetota bacterium]|nr:glycosyltransferase family 39 protein [Planctomycetota bacterium]
MPVTITEPLLTHRLDQQAHRYRMALIIVAAALLYVAGSWCVSLWDRDEPWYCQTSRQMVQSGDWVVPHFLDEPRCAKPIFIYWCQAASMTVFGTNPFAARLVSALAMTVTLIVLSVTLSRAIGVRRAMLTLLIFATSAMVIASAKMCLTDSVLLVFITGMQFCLFRLYWMSRRRRSDSTLPTALLMWVLMGLAGLTKGPSALILMLASMVFLAMMDVGGKVASLQAWRKAIGWWREVRFGRGLAIVLLIGLPWLVTAYLRDPAFVRQMLGEPGRHLASNQDGHSMSPGYYLMTVWITYFPWSLFLPTTLVLAWKHRRLPHVRFALAIIASNWLFQEMMVTKLPHYILPSFASLAFLTSMAIIRCQRRQHDDLHRRTFAVAVAIWVCGALVGAALPLLGAIKFHNPSGLGAVLFAVVGAAYAGAAGVLLMRRRFSAAMALMGGGMVLLIAILYLVYLPNAQFLRLPERVGSFLRAQRAVGQGQVVMIGYDEPSLAFYQGGTIRSKEKSYLRQVAPAEWPQWIVMTAKVFNSLPQDRKERLERAASFSGVNYNTGGNVVDLWVMRKKDSNLLPTSEK